MKPKEQILQNVQKSNKVPKSIKTKKLNEKVEKEEIEKMEINKEKS